MGPATKDFTIMRNIHYHQDDKIRIEGREHQTAKELEEE